MSLNVPNSQMRLEAQPELLGKLLPGSRSPLCALIHPRGNARLDSEYRIVQLALGNIFALYPLKRQRDRDGTGWAVHLSGPPDGRLHLLVQARRVDGHHLLALGVPEHIEIRVTHRHTAGQRVREVQ